MNPIDFRPTLVLFTFLFLSTILQAQIPPKRDRNYVPSHQSFPSLNTNGNGSNNTTRATSSIDYADIRLNPLSQYPQTEPHISINKNNPSNLLVSMNTSNTDFNHPTNPHFNSIQGYYYSMDGGLTWTGSDFLPNESSSYSVGDPSTCFDAAGNAYISTLGPDPVWPANHNDAINYSIQKSIDGGFSWQPQVVGAGSATGTAPPRFDRPMITCDDVLSSPFVNYFYAVWTEFNNNIGYIKLNLSNDGAATFTPPITLRNSPGIGFGASVKTGPAGDCYVSWAEYGTSSQAQSVKFSVSTDAWTTYTTSTAFTYTGINYGGASFSYNPHLNYIRTPDYTTMAVDKSCGTYNGRIYIAYAASFFPNSVFNSRIQVRYSDDHGTTWSPPVTVNIANGLINYMPWLAVDDATGLVCLAYYSANYSANPVPIYPTDTYLAYSDDGGINWNNQRVSDVSFTTKAVWGIYMGDYLGVTAYNGNAYVAWCDNRLLTSNPLPAQWQTYVSRVSFGTPLVGDLYIKDTQTPVDDNGTEPNPDNPWNIVDGVDVWVRNTPETQTATSPPRYSNEHAHSNAEWSSTWSTNNATLPRIYVKVRNRGCSTVSGTVRLYYHVNTLNDQWNTCVNGQCGSWQEIFCEDFDGDNTIDPGESNNCSSNKITLAPGQEGVIEQIWYPAQHFPDPTILGNRNEYCLLARLICDGGLDPITTEVILQSAGVNAKNINNIVQKNVVFVNNTPGIIGNNVNFGNYSEKTSTNKLELVDASLTSFTGSQGWLTIDLGKDLYNSWVNGGRKGRGIVENNEFIHISPTGTQHKHSPTKTNLDPYSIRITEGNAMLENITLAPQQLNTMRTKFNFYSGPASKEPFQYSLRQYESFTDGKDEYAFTGALKYYINKPACDSVNAGSDVEMLKECSVKLIATPNTEIARYIWRDNITGDSIGSGPTVYVSPRVTTSYELEVSTPDFCYAYDVVTVNVNPKKIPCKCKRMDKRNKRKS